MNHTTESRKAVIAACVGNLFEWYDFGVYAFLATTISAKFFPSGDSTASLLFAFAAYGVGFLARPIGGFVIGWMGDAVGRKSALILTLLMMAFGTVGIGLLPTYESIGIWASILITALRIIQGIAAGGEWGTSTAFIYEWAPAHRHGFVCSFQQVSTAAGSLLGSAFAALTITLLSTEQMQTWGWRVPFILGIGIVFSGIYLRRCVSETPAFSQKHLSAATASGANGLKLAGVAFGLIIFPAVAYYMLLAWMPSFTQLHGGLTPS